MVLMASTSQALTGHISVLESKKSPLYSLAFSLALKIYVLGMEGVAGIWVTPRCVTTHVCCRGIAAKRRTSGFLDIKEKMQTNRRTLKSFVAQRQGHSSFLLSYQCSWSHTVPSVCTVTQLLLCVSHCSAWSHHQDLMEKFCHLLSFLSSSRFRVSTQSWKFTLETV